MGVQLPVRQLWTTTNSSNWGKHNDGSSSCQWDNYEPLRTLPTEVSIMTVHALVGRMKMNTITIAFTQLINVCLFVVPCVCCCGLTCWVQFYSKSLPIKARCSSKWAINALYKWTTVLHFAGQCWVILLQFQTAQWFPSRTKTWFKFSTLTYCVKSAHYPFHPRYEQDKQYYLVSWAKQPWNVILYFICISSSSESHFSIKQTSHYVTRSIFKFSSQNHFYHHVVYAMVTQYICTAQKVTASKSS